MRHFLSPSLHFLRLFFLPSTFDVITLTLTALYVVFKAHLNFRAEYHFHGIKNRQINLSEVFSGRFLFSGSSRARDNSLKSQKQLSVHFACFATCTHARMHARTHVRTYVRVCRPLASLTDPSGYSYTMWLLYCCYTKQALNNLLCLSVPSSYVLT